ncbi:MAG: class I SAM-dependent methyltransferase [Mucilaginibacter sp.]
MQNTILQTFGNIDIYLFDQLLKGRFDNCKTVLDIGCGSGRNLHYFLRNGYEVFGIDQNPEAIAHVQQLAAELAPGIPKKNFVVNGADHLMYNDSSFDLVISSAVLHFAEDENHFDRMVRSAFRVLKPGGYFFARLASDIGLESLVIPVGGGRYLLPEGSERFLVNEKTLLRYTRELNGILYEPIKTTNVQNFRCMTTWCVQKQ